MNFPDYLNRVRQEVWGCSREKLEAFVYEVAAVLPEEMQVDFLSALHKVHTPRFCEPNASENVPKEALDSVRKVLDKIEDGTISLTAGGTEDYNENRCTLADGLAYKDADLLVQRLGDAVALHAQCVNCGAYSEVLSLGKQLLSIQVRVIRPNSDEEIYRDLVDIGDLFHTGWDVNAVVLNTLVAAYRCSENPQRDIYDVLSNPAFRDAYTLKSLLQYAWGQLDRFPDFLQGWVALLAQETGASARKLYQEAIAMLPTPVEE